MIHSNHLTYTKLAISSRQSFIICMILPLLFLSTFVYSQEYDTPIYFKKKLSTIKEVLILPVNFDCFYLTSGGIREYNYKLTSSSRRMIMENIGKILTDHSFSVTTLPENSYVEKCWNPFRHFYSVVNHEILLNVYGNSRFPDAVTTFTYSLPPIPDSLLYPTTDAILFIDGFDDCATTQRLKNKNVATAMAAISVASLVLGGPGVFISVPEDQTIASCALVDRSGKIIWYYRYRKEGTIDMTCKSDVKEFFLSLLYQLYPGVAKNDNYTP